jgi:hypothetical protein
MLHRRLVLLPALLGWLCAMAPARAQDPACHECGGDGRIDCSKHGKSWLEKERAVRFCSVAAQCKACGGALEVACKQCRSADVEKALQARRDLVRSWRDNLRTTVDDLAKGDPMQHLCTEHFDLSFGIEKLTVGRDKLDTHAAMHLYGERLEALRALVLQTLALEEKDFTSRLRVFVCRDQLQSANLAPHVTGIGGLQAVGTKLMGVETVYCMWMNPRQLLDDEGLHRNLVHCTTHLILSNMALCGEFGKPGNGWVAEGIASWFEDKICGKCTNYCFEEVLTQNNSTFKSGRWRVPVRKLAEEGKLVSLASLAGKNYDQLEFPIENMMSFAMVDYLLTVHGGTKMRDFLRLLKDKQAMRDAMQSVYGMNPLTFDTQFDTWVKATYPQQDVPR